MKRVMLPLILILFLTFTLIGNCDWLSGWDYRIECSIEDYANDIGGEVVWFPATIFLTSTQGEEIFVELTTDAEYLKTQITESDGTTKLYGECELFDVSEEKGIFHVSRDGWTINSNDSVFIYYDKDHADNTDWIGAITARTEVWDGNTEAHWDMAQDPNGDGANAIKDSTSNTRHLTPIGTMLTEDLVDAKIGKGINLEGTDDGLFKASSDIGITNAFTVSMWAKLDTDSIGMLFITPNNTGTGLTNAIYIVRYSTDTEKINVKMQESDGSGYIKDFISAGTMAHGSFYHIAATWDGTDLHIYINGLQSTPYTKITDDAETMTNTNRMIEIGHQIYDSVLYSPWDGIMDETIYASVARSAAWMKGLYNSGDDGLFAYGSEEGAPVTEVNVINMGINF